MLTPTKTATDFQFPPRRGERLHPQEQIVAELLAAIQQVHEGGAPMSMRIARKVVAFFNQLRTRSRIGAS